MRAETTTALRAEVGRVRISPVWTIPVGLVLGHLILALLVFDPTPHTGGDNAAYISLAQSLLEHGTYQELYDPALPPHTQYPPAFPGIIALATLLGLGSWVGLKLVIIAFSGLAVGSTYLWARRRSGPRLALGVSAIVGASPFVLDLAHWILSDVPFWALTALALWGYDELDEGGRGASMRRVALIAAIGGTVLAYFTRSAGLPLVLASASWLVWRRRWREVALLAAILLPLTLGWWLRAHAQGGVDYVGQFWWIDPYTPELGRIGIADLLARVAENGRKYLFIHLPLLSIGRSGGLLTGVALLTAVLALAGWAKRLRKLGVAELFFPLYLGLILIWPAVWSGERFLLPAYPLMILYAAEAITGGADRLREGAARPVGVAIVVVILASITPLLGSQIRYGSECVALYRSGERYPCLDPASYDFFATADWSSANLPEDAVVISRKPRLFYGLSGRRGLIFPLSSDPEAFFTSVRESGARYLVIDQMTALTARYIGPVIDGFPQAFCFLHSTAAGHAAVLGILPEEIWSAGGAGVEADTGVGFSRCPSSYLRPDLEE